MSKPVLALNVRKAAVGKTLRASCCMPVHLEKSNRLVRAICREREKAASNRSLRLVLDIHLTLSSAGLSKKSGWGSFEIGG